MNLHAEGIETVEDLAGLNDSVVVGFQGMLDLRKKAQAYLSSLHPEKMEAERQALQDEKDAQAERMADMEEQMRVMEQALKQATIKPKRTRRKRNAEGVLEA